MSNKNPWPLVVEGKLTDAERMKKESHFLRGTIAEDLNDGLTGGFNGGNILLIRFHSMYQRDDRDIRTEQKLEPRYAMMLCCRLPSAVCRLPSAVCRLPSAVWRVACGVWRVACGVWYHQPTAVAGHRQICPGKHAVRQHSHHQPSNFPASRHS